MRLPGSDVDLLVVVDAGEPSFRHSVIDGIRVEEHRTTTAKLRETMTTRPSLALGVEEAVILLDRDGVGDGLKADARRVLADFAPTTEDQARLAYWLRTAAEKVTAARAAGDDFRAALVAAATTWPLVEGLWSVDGLPAPTVGAVPSRLAGLGWLTSDGRASLERMLLGDATERVAAFVHLAGRVAAALEAVSARST